MSQDTLYEERLQRIKSAVALERPDRVPVVLEYAGFAARVTHTSYPAFLRNLGTSVQVMMQAYQQVAEGGAADAVNYGCFSPYALSYLWLSRVRVPGVDLPDHVSYQVVEQELMTPADYDRILHQGWPAFYRAFLHEQALRGVPAAYLPANQPPVEVREAWARIGVPVLRLHTIAPPLEFLCGGRSLTCFALDLIDRPDTVAAVMEEVMAHLSTLLRHWARQEGYPAIWVGGWRSAPLLLSPRLWNRFVWPYFRRLVHEVIGYGLIPLLHLDASWDRELERFRELPKGTCIMALDGDTDIFRAKEVVGDHMCIMGDVPASMLCLADPDTVFRYSTRLIRELGPEGFILQSGCDIPENAKLENVQAMVAAAVGA